MDLMWVNKDLLTEILLRLPAKSLIRFKSVCKKWLKLISSDYFCHRHTLRGPKLQQSLIIQMHTRQLFYFNPTTNGEKVIISYTLSVPDHHHHQIVEGCNGLLLLLFNPLNITRVQKRHPGNSYYVYNPTTNKSRKITLTNSNNYPFVENITLVFDPSKSPYYKIICVRSDMELNLYYCTYQIEVYDSESHTWKLGLGPFIHPVIFDGVHWNNSIYWTNIPLDRGHYCSFDIAKNEMKTLDSPPFPYPYKGLFRRVRCHLQESNGYLYHFEYLKLILGRDPCLSVTVWELGGDNDDSQWLLKHHHEIHPHSRDVYPVRFMDASDGDEMCSLLTYEPKPKQGRMMAYNFLDKSYEPLVDLACQPPMFFDQIFMTCLQFGEVLALV